MSQATMKQNKENIKGENVNPSAAVKVNTDNPFGKNYLTTDGGFGGFGTGNDSDKNPFSRKVDPSVAIVLKDKESDKNGDDKGKQSEPKGFGGFGATSDVKGFGGFGAKLVAEKKNPDKPPVGFGGFGAKADGKTQGGFGGFGLPEGAPGGDAGCGVFGKPFKMPEGAAPLFGSDAKDIPGKKQVNRKPLSRAEIVTNFQERAKALEQLAFTPPQIVKDQYLKGKQPDDFHAETAHLLRGMADDVKKCVDERTFEEQKADDARYLSKDMAGQIMIWHNVARLYEDESVSLGDICGKLAVIYRQRISNLEKRLGQKKRVVAQVAPTRSSIEKSTLRRSSVPSAPPKDSPEKPKGRRLSAHALRMVNRFQQDAEKAEKAGDTEKAERYRRIAKNYEKKELNQEQARCLSPNSVANLAKSWREKADFMEGLAGDDYLHPLRKEARELRKWAEDADKIHKEKVDALQKNANQRADQPPPKARVEATNKKPDEPCSIFSVPPKTAKNQESIFAGSGSASSKKQAPTNMFGEPVPAKKQAATNMFGEPVPAKSTKKRAIGTMLEDSTAASSKDTPAITKIVKKQETASTFNPATHAPSLFGGAPSPFVSVQQHASANTNNAKKPAATSIFGAPNPGATSIFGATAEPVRDGSKSSSSKDVLVVTNPFADKDKSKDEAVSSKPQEKTKKQPKGKTYEVKFAATNSTSEDFIWDAIEAGDLKLLKAYCPPDFDFLQLDPREQSKGMTCMQALICQNCVTLMDEDLVEDKTEKVVEVAKWLMECGADPSQQASKDCKSSSEIKATLPDSNEIKVSVQHGGRTAITSLLNLRSGLVRVMQDFALGEMAKKTDGEDDKEDALEFVGELMEGIHKRCELMINVFSEHVVKMPQQLKSLTISEGVVEAWERYRQACDARDVTLDAKNADQSVKAHGHFLSSVSPVLKLMLNGTFVESKDKVICIDDELAPNALTLFIDLLYCGSSSLDERTCTMVLDVFDLAHRWQIGYVCEICERWLVEMMDNKNIEDITKIALTKNVSSLELACRRYVESNKASFVDMPAILEDLMKPGRSQGENEPPKKKRRC